MTTMVPTADPVQTQTARKLLSVTKRTQENNDQNNNQQVAVEATRVKIKAVTKKRVNAIRKSGRPTGKGLLVGTLKGISLGGLKLAPKPYCMTDLDEQTQTKANPKAKTSAKPKTPKTSSIKPDPQDVKDPESDCDSDCDSDSDTESHGVYQRWIAGAVRLISTDNKYIFDPDTCAHIGTVVDDDIQWHKA